MSSLMAEREIEAGPVNWEGCGAHTSQLCDWRRGVLLVRAAEAKILLQSLVVLSEKKDGKRKNRTNMVFLLINMMELDCFSIVVCGVRSEML